MTLLPHTSQRPAGRKEDPRLLTGAGLFVHDVSLPGMLHVAFARSAYAHGRIERLETAAALEVEGVVAVYTGHDTQDLLLPAANPVLDGMLRLHSSLLPVDAVDHVGQPVALVVARSRDAAQRGADAVWLDCEARDARLDHATDAEPLAAVRYQAGPMSAVAATQVRVRHEQPRVVAFALETRAAIARWDAQASHLEAWLPTQTPWRAKNDLAALLQLDPAQVRVVAPDVGGAFGARSSLGPEELLVAWAARRQGGALKWVGSRSEEFTSAVQGRGMRLSGELGLDADGRFSVLRADIEATAGAWMPYSAAVPVRNAARILPGPYQVGSLSIEGRLRRSHAAPVTIYRGAGRPEAALLMEWLVERAARRAGLDPLDLRRRNLIRAEQMPFTSPTGEMLESGDYGAALELAAQKFDYGAERARQAERRARGEVVGVGTALYIEPCGQGWESARVTLQADGRVEVASGSSAQGQGHETSYAAIAAEVLGCDSAQVQVRHGDTAHGPAGIGALASRSMAIGGSAVLEAAREVARRRDAGEALPLSVERVYEAPAEAWSYGCVMARVRIDAETGKPQVERLLWVDDAGHVVSPQLARGQLLGGLAQGLGQALFERIVYDDDGQLVTGSLMDYAVPRAADVPMVELHGLHLPTRANALGAKGVGEAGCIGVPAALLNAAADALSPWGEPELDFPLTAERLWRAMQSTDGKKQS